MADYDLGKAHGEIVITNDRRATDQAAQAYRELREDLKKIESQLQRLNSALATNAKALENHSQAAQGAANSVDSLGNSHRETSRKMAVTNTMMKAFAATAKNGTTAAQNLSYGIADVGKQFVGFKNMSLKREDIFRNIAQLGFLINDARIKTKGLRVAIANTQKFFAQISVWATDAAVAMDKFAGAASKSGRTVGPLTQSLNNQAKAYQALATRLNKAGPQLNAFQSFMRGLKNGTAATGRGLTKLSFRIGGVKKAMAELSDGEQQIMQIAGAVVLLGRAINALRSYALAAASAISTMATNAAVASFQALSTAISAVRVKALALADSLRKAVDKAVLAGIGLLIERFGALGMSIAWNLIRFQEAAKSFAANNVVTRTLAASFGALGAKMGVAAKGTGAYLKSLAFFGSIALGVDKQFSSLVSKSNALSKAFKQNTKAFGGMGRGLTQMAGGTMQAITGFAMVRRATRGLRAALNVAAFGFQALNVAGMALVGIGHVIMGIVSAAKQLSGVLFALPGSLAALAVAGGVAAAGLKGLFDALKAGAGDADKFDEATKNLSPELKKLAGVVKGLKEPFREMRDTIQDEMFRGLGNEIERIANGYLPMLNSGTKNVATSFRSFTDAFTRHMSSQQSIVSMNKLFNASSTIVANLGKAFGPALDGMRALGTAGAQTLADLSKGASNVTVGFSIWAQKISESGQLDEMIRNGIQGFSNLGATIRNLGGMVGDFFKAIGITGENSLQRMADATSRWRESFSKALGGDGAIQQFVSHLKSMANYTRVAFDRIASSLSSLFSSSGDQLAGISEAINQGFVVGVTKAIGALTKLIALVSHIPGVSAFMGIAVALSAMSKVTKLAFTTFGKLVGGIVGAVSSFRGATTALTGYVAAVEAGTKGSNMMSRTIQKMGITARGVQIAMAGLGSALAVAFIAFTSYQAASAKVDAFNKLMTDSSDEVATAQHNLAKAFNESSGAMSPEVFDQVESSMSNFLDTQKRISEQSKSSFIDQSIGGLSELFTLGKSDMSNNLIHMDKMIDRSKAFNEAISKTKTTQTDLTQAITGSDEAYNNFARRLYDAQGGGDATIINQILEARNRFQDMKASMERIGPESITLGNALRVIADESANAADKMGAMTTALQTMGLLQVSEVESAGQLTEKIKGLAEAMQEPLGPANQLGMALIDEVTGGLLASNPAAQELQRRLGPLQQSLQSVALAGGDVGRYYDEQVAPALENVRRMTGLSEEKFQALIRTMGFVPDEISIMANLKGNLEADLYAASAKINTLIDQPYGVEVTTRIQDQGAVDRLREIGVWVDQISGTEGEVRIHFPDEESKREYEKLINDIIADGKKNPVKIPSKLEPPKEGLKPGKSSGSGKVDAPPTPTSTPTAPPKTVETKVKVTGWESSEGTLNRIKGLANSLKSVQATITVKVAGWDSTEGTLNRIKNLANSLRAVQAAITVRVAGWDSTEGTLNRIKGLANSLRSVQGTITVKVAGWKSTEDTLNRLRDIANQMGNSVEINVRLNAGGVVEALNGIKGALDNLIPASDAAAAAIEGSMRRAVAAINSVLPALNGVKNQLNGMASSAYSSGAALGQGFADGINSKIGAVNAAANALAQAAARPLPHSPAKEGPFSGRGWTPFRGRSLAEGFAQGILDGSDGAKSASLEMAEAVSSALDKVRVAVGLQRTFFDANEVPGIGGKRYYRDPNVSDAELEKARREKAEQEAQDAKDQAYRDARKAGQNLPEQKDKVKEAEERTRKAEERLANAKEKGDADKIKEAEKSLNKAKESEAKQRDRLSKMENDLKNNPSGLGKRGSLTDEELARMGGGTVNKSLLEALRGAGFQGQLLSAKTDHSVDNGLHPQGKAIDFAPDDEAAKWLFENRKALGLAQIIYGGAGGKYNYYNRGGIEATGQDAVGIYGADVVYGQHSNHIHVGADSEINLAGASSKNLERTAQNTGTTADSTTKTIPLIKKADGTYGSTSAEWDRLMQRESGGRPDVVQGIQDANSGGNEASGLFQIAKGTWAANGGSRYAATAGQATPEQQAEIAAKIFEKSGAQPWGNRENEALLRQGLTNGQPGSGSGSGSGSDSEDSISDEEWGKQALAEERSQNKKLDEAIDVLEDQNSSIPEVIRALQEVDNSIATAEDPDMRDQLKQIRDNTMQDRGIKEYDPKEGASEDPFMDTVGILQNILGLYRTIEQGFEAAQATFELLVRGFENTKDVESFVDGVQSISQAVSSIISTVGSMVDVAASLAAAAGSSIPGVGQVTGVLGTITGGIGNVNAVVDLIQEAWSIGSRYLGYALSWLAGGANGSLRGDVKALLDTNDQTLKTWSSDNALDKNTFNLDPFNLFPDKPERESTNTYNIYANPNAPASEIINELGYAVRTTGNGAYQE